MFNKYYGTKLILLEATWVCMLFQLALRFPINREGYLGIWLQKHGLCF